MLDSLSIVSETFAVEGVGPSSFFLDPAAAILVWKKPLPQIDSVRATYKVFPFNFTRVYQNKDPALIRPKTNLVRDPFKYTTSESQEPLISWGELDKRGSISRGISFGNNQSLGVNSTLNLQLSGKITDRFSLLAAISDENIPIQAEGNTQQLQDFDQVYVQVFDDNNRITAGDFQILNPEGYFMRYNKKLQGAMVESRFLLSKEDSAAGMMHVQASGAISKGKFARQIVPVIEGNQGPYKLVGAEGEPFIVVLSGTERIYLDGRLLVRGQENDYVIDYNTAELTFTANVLITKDRRIIAEYQYSDRNYARSLVQAHTGFTNRKWDVNMNIYSEQDAKNQPLQQDLTDAQKNVLRTIGDSLDQAIAPAVDTTTFNPELILYRKIDTAWVDALSGDSVFAEDVYVHSTDPELAIYQLGFSEVGLGNGNYILVERLANGRVYEWVPPVGGVPQGNFEPVVLLIAPKKKQMLSVNSTFRPSDKVQVFVETAVTNEDVNTFSRLDHADNTGIGIKTRAEGAQPLGTTRWEFIAAGDYEFVGRHFSEVERFRPVEFDRDWNIRNLELNQDQHIAGAEAGFRKGTLVRTVYGLKTFSAGDDYTGLQHSIDLRSQERWVRGAYNASLLNVQGSLLNTRFLQHNSLVEKPVWRIVLGYRDDFERNEIKDVQQDTLLANAYQFWEWEAFIANEDTAANRYRISYTERTDWSAKNNELTEATFARTYGYSFGLNKNPASIFRFTGSYRQLHIRDSMLTSVEPENTLLNRVEYQFRLFRGAISGLSFYEIGSGLENAREYIFFPTAPGQGTHIWMDYNENGQKELGEYEEAVLADQKAGADYIKIYVPTNEYIKVFSNQFSQNINLRPAAVWRGKNGIRHFISHFSDQFIYSIDRKSGGLTGVERFNPFYDVSLDTALRSLNANFRNTFYLNQTDPVWGADITVQEVKNRILLTNGFESRTLSQYSIGGRWNLTTIFGIYGRYEEGAKRNVSDAGALSARNFDIAFYSIQPRVYLQPTTQWRISLFYTYDYKQNAPNEINPVIGGERTINQTVGSEFTLNSAEKGSLLVNVSLIDIQYRGMENSPVAFEMLDGLQDGTNATWGVSYVRTLANNLQVSLNYNGRKSEGINTIHTGGVQARAFF